jgi:hypothetical protein
MSSSLKGSTILPSELKIVGEGQGGEQGQGALASVASPFIRSSEISGGGGGWQHPVQDAPAPGVGVRSQTTRQVLIPNKR